MFRENHSRCARFLAPAVRPPIAGCEVAIQHRRAVLVRLVSHRYHPCDCPNSPQTDRPAIPVRPLGDYRTLGDDVEPPGVRHRGCHSLRQNRRRVARRGDIGTLLEGKLMRKNLASLFAVLAVCGFMCVGSAAADTITLTSTVRDFHASHSDFEGAIASDRGFVDTTIGADRKPVYVGGTGTATTSGAANFNQWYNDVPGVNMSTDYDLVLDNGVSGQGGVYTFSDTSFFPIDDELFGNEGNPHNYHFTLELHAEFNYEAGLVFDVTADDDLLIFVNDILVLDLGGVHAPQSSSFSLDNFGLVEGEDYAFDLFFAERHLTQSNLCFSTNIALVPEPATVSLLVLGGLAMLKRRRG